MLSRAIKTLKSVFYFKKRKKKRKNFITSAMQINNIHIAKPLLRTVQRTRPTFTSNC